MKGLKGSIVESINRGECYEERNVSLSSTGNKAMLLSVLPVLPVLPLQYFHHQ